MKLLLGNFLLPAAVSLLALIASGGVRPATLKPVDFNGWQRIPFELEVPIVGGGIGQSGGAVGEIRSTKPLLRCQQPLVDLISQARFEQKKKDLWIHLPGEKRPIKIKGGRKATVVELPTEGREVPVMFYSKQGQWYAAPAQMLRGKTSLGELEILDVDLDGKFDSPMDFISWRGGRLHLQGTQPRVFSEDGLHRYELTLVKNKTQVLLSVAKFPDEVESNSQQAWLATNRLRNTVGLEPVQLDVKRTADAAKHAHYLQINRSSSGGSLNVHTERLDLPGYTPEGRIAAGGNVMWGSGGHSLPTQPIHEFATLFHRGEYLYPSLTMGAAGEGGYAVVWVEDAQLDTARWLQKTGMESHWVMTPAPGQQNVPRLAKRDSPTPASVPDFYNLQRGWPISVSCSYTYGELSDVHLDLFDSSGKQVDGFAITMTDAGFTSDGFSADYLFAAKTALESKSSYRAEFSARLKKTNRQLHYSWTFTTGK